MRIITGTEQRRLQLKSPPMDAAENYRRSWEQKFLSGGNVQIIGTRGEFTQCIHNLYSWIQELKPCFQLEFQSLETRWAVTHVLQCVKGTWPVQISWVHAKDTGCVQSGLVEPHNTASFTQACPFMQRENTHVQVPTSIFTHEKSLFSLYTWQGTPPPYPQLPTCS